MIEARAKNIELVVARKQIYFSEPLLLFLILPLTTLCLLIPLLYIRACILLIFGALIYSMEKKLGLTVPASPGIILWFSSFCSYVIGGICTGFFFNGWEVFGIRHLDITLLYLGIGFSSYCIGLTLTAAFSRRSDSLAHETKKKFMSIKSALWISGLFVFPVIAKNIVNSSIYDNLVIGALQSIQYLPIIILSMYLFYHRANLLISLLLFASAFSVPFSGMILGYGRSQILKCGFSLLLVWLYLNIKSGRRLSKKSKMICLITPFILIFLFGILTNYRQTVRFNRLLSSGERINILQNSFQKIYHSKNNLIDNLGSLTSRFVEKESIELLHFAESGIIKHSGWTMEDLRQIVFSWIPKFVYHEKGVGYGRDIMEFYGFTVYNNLPVTILTDAYRRSGVYGVIFLYFFISIVSTFVAMHLPRYFGNIGIIMALYFALLHLNLYSADALSVFKLYAYRLPSSGLIIYFIMHITGLSKKIKYDKFSVS